MMVGMGIGAAVGGVVGAGAAGANAAATGKDLAEEMQIGAWMGGLVGAYLGQVGGASKKGEGWTNMGAAAWVTANGLMTGAVGLDFIVPQQYALTTAIVGICTHINNGVPPTPGEVLLIKTGVEGIGFQAAASSVGLTSGIARSAGMLIQQFAARRGLKIPAPNSPMMAVLTPDMGGVAFGAILGAKVAYNVLYAYRHGHPPVVDAYTGVEGNWRDFSSALAAALGIMLTISITVFVHRESKFGLPPPPKPGEPPPKPPRSVDAMISRCNAVYDATAGLKAPIVFAFKNLVGKGGLLEKFGCGPQVVAGASGAAFFFGILWMSKEFLILAQHNDGGPPGNGAERPLDALRALRDGDRDLQRLDLPVKALEGRLLPEWEKRVQRQLDIGLTQHVLEVLDTVYRECATALITYVLFNALRHSGHGIPFQMPQDEIDDRLFAQDTSPLEAAAQAAAGALALLCRAGFVHILKWAASRSDFDARRAFGSWVAMAIGASAAWFETSCKCSILGNMLMGQAVSAIVDELWDRIANAKAGSAHPAPSAKLRASVAAIAGGQTVPGPLERFVNYFWMAFEGTLTEPQARRETPIRRLEVLPDDKAEVSLRDISVDVDDAGAPESKAPRSPSRPAAAGSGMDAARAASELFILFPAERDADRPNEGRSGTPIDDKSKRRQTSEDAVALFPDSGDRSNQRRYSMSVSNVGGEDAREELSLDPELAFLGSNPFGLSGITCTASSVTNHIVTVTVKGSQYRKLMRHADNARLAANGRDWEYTFTVEKLRAFFQTVSPDRPRPGRSPG
jgi:hypothetical protein